MDNINLEITEKLPFIAQMMESTIPDDAMVITIKINNVDLEMNQAFYISPLLRYLTDLDVNILASSGGLHLNGKAQKPHIHFHLIVERFNPPTNPSQHRQRWCKKTDNDLGDVSFKFQKLDVSNPKYSILSYPLKEGKFLTDKRAYTINGEQMSNEIKDFLCDVGKAIYDKELGLALRQEKCEERKQLALLNLYQLCLDNKDKFTSYTTMMLWLDENYIDKLDITEYPDPKNYKTYCQKIAVKLKFIKYSSI